MSVIAVLLSGSRSEFPLLHLSHYRKATALPKSLRRSTEDIMPFHSIGCREPDERASPSSNLESVGNSGAAPVVSSSKFYKRLIFRGFANRRISPRALSVISTIRPADRSLIMVLTSGLRVWQNLFVEKCAPTLWPGLFILYRRLPAGVFHFSLTSVLPVLSLRLFPLL